MRAPRTITLALLLLAVRALSASAQLTPQQHETLQRCRGLGDFTSDSARARDAGRPRQALLDAQRTPVMPRQPAAVSLQVQRAVIEAAYAGPRMEPAVWGLLALDMCLRLDGDFGRLGTTVQAQMRDMVLSQAWAEEAAYFGISPAPQKPGALCTGYGRMAEALARERDRGATRDQLLGVGAGQACDATSGRVGAPDLPVHGECRGGAAPYDTGRPAAAR